MGYIHPFIHVLDRPSAKKSPPTTAWYTAAYYGLEHGRLLRPGYYCGVLQCRNNFSHSVRPAFVVCGQPVYCAPAVLPIPAPTVLRQIAWGRHLFLFFSGVHFVAILATLLGSLLST